MPPTDAARALATRKGSEREGQADEVSPTCPLKPWRGCNQAKKDPVPLGVAHNCPVIASAPKIRAVEISQGLTTKDKPGPNPSPTRRGLFLQLTGGTEMAKKDTQFRGQGKGTKSGDRPICARFPPDIAAILRALPNTSEYVQQAVIRQLRADGLIE